MTTGGSHSSHGHARPPASKPRLLWLQSLHREMAGAGSPFKGKEYHPSSFPHPTQANAPLSYQRPQGTIGVQSSTSLTEHQRARHPDRRWGHSRKQTTCCVHGVYTLGGRWMVNVSPARRRGMLERKGTEVGTSPHLCAVYPTAQSGRRGSFLICCHLLSG